MLRVRGAVIIQHTAILHFFFFLQIVIIILANTYPCTKLNVFHFYEINTCWFQYISMDFERACQLNNYISYSIEGNLNAYKGIFYTLSGNIDIVNVRKPQIFNQSLPTQNIWYTKQLLYQMPECLTNNKSYVKTLWWTILNPFL